MAPKRTAAQRQEIQDFVDWLFERSGEPTWAAFAQRAGVHNVSISEWHRGEAIPDGLNLYRMISAALVDAKQLEEALAEDGPPALQDPLQRLRDAGADPLLVEVLELAFELIRRVNARVDEVDARTTTDPDPPSRSATRRRKG